MTRVYLVQALCPNRHAIAALSFQGEVEEVEASRETLIEDWVQEIDMVLAGKPESPQLQELLGGTQMNPWCGICGARRETWIFELGETRFASMEEAQPVLNRNQMEHMMTRLLIEFRRMDQALKKAANN